MPATRDHRRTSSSLKTTLAELMFVPSASASSRRISSADIVKPDPVRSFATLLPAGTDVDRGAEVSSTGRASKRPAFLAPSLRRLPRVCTAVVVLLLFSPGPARLDVVFIAALAFAALLPGACPCACPASSAGGSGFSQKGHMTGSSPIPGTASPKLGARFACAWASSDLRVGGASSNSAIKSVDICEIFRPKFASRGGRDGTVNSKAGSTLDGAERAYGPCAGMEPMGVLIICGAEGAGAEGGGMVRMGAAYPPDAPRAVKGVEGREGGR